MFLMFFCTLLLFFLSLQNLRPYMCARTLQKITWRRVYTKSLRRSDKPSTFASPSPLIVLIALGTFLP